MKDLMHFFLTVTTRPLRAACVAALTLLAALQSANAQSTCASDGQPRPVRLMERFISADCESCWKDPATTKVGNGDVVLDWVLASDKGDDAPLSAVASRDGLIRLAARGAAAPKEAMTSTQKVNGLKGTTLRVAHGIALSGYLGTSIELKPIPPTAKNQRWTAWLALVETIPEGTEGTPVARNLVRNLIQPNWDGYKQLSKSEQKADVARFFESRSMSVAQGVNPDNLRVIGWVEDARGRVLVAAQSRCEVEGK